MVVYYYSITFTFGITYELLLKCFKEATFHYDCRHMRAIIVTEGQ